VRDFHLLLAILSEKKEALSYVVFREGAVANSDNRNGVVLALVGESGAGKTTSTAIIADMGFAPIALAKRLRETAIARYGKPERAQVQNLARETQAIHGDDYYARVALSDPSFSQPGDVIIDGLRNVAELEYTTKAVADSGRNFFLVAVLASDEMRFSRVVNRGRAGDPLVRERFEEDDARARGSAEDGFQQNSILIEMAEHTLYNTGDMETLRARIREAVEISRRTDAGETTK
jgi:dephospho-CoA kinase